MDLKPNHKYKFIVSIGNKILHFTGIVISVKEDFVSFKDKFCEILTYSKKVIVSYQEVKNE